MPGFALPSGRLRNVVATIAVLEIDASGRDRARSDPWRRIGKPRRQRFTDELHFPSVAAWSSSAALIDR